MIIMVVMVIITKIINIRDALGSLFFGGVGQKKKSPGGQGGAGSKILGRGGVIVKLRAFSGPWWARAAIFPRAGAGRASLVKSSN